MATRYWVGNGGTWVGTTHWSTSSGGSAGASSPTIVDDVIFDANSFSSASQAVTVTNNSCKSINLSAVTNNPSFNFAATFLTNTLRIAGDFVGGTATFQQTSGVAAGMLFIDNAGTTPHNFTQNGATINVSLLPQNTGQFTMLSDLVIGGTKILNILGPFDANDFDVTAGAIEFGGGGDIHMRSGTWTIKPTTQTITFMGSGPVAITNVMAETSTLIFDLSVFTSSTYTFRKSGGDGDVDDLTFNDLIIKGNGTTDKTLYFDTRVNTNFTSVLVQDSPITIKLHVDASTHINTTTLNMNGSSGKLITIISDSAGNQASLKSTNSPSISYVDVMDNIAGGAGIPFVDINGVDSGNNTNWSFGITANFTGTPLSGVAPLTVTFTDTSSDAPTSWLWNFGDGGTSTLQNPVYIYNTPGIYTVVLTATNVTGSDIETKTNYIEVIEPGILPTYNPSIITVVKRVKQTLPAPEFIIGGQGGEFLDEFYLFKKDTFHTFNLWRSSVFNIGKDFDVLSIEFNLVPDLTDDVTIIPKLYFDNGRITSYGTTINTSNYSNTNKLIQLTTKNFLNKAHGEHNFFLEFQFTGSDLAVISTPINIELEVAESV